MLPDKLSIHGQVSFESALLQLPALNFLRSLSNEEVNDIQLRVVEQLKNQFGVEIR